MNADFQTDSKKTVIVLGAGKEALCIAPWPLFIHIQSFRGYWTDDCLETPRNGTLSSRDRRGHLTH
jgi:hypothetical protein